MPPQCSLSALTRMLGFGPLGNALHILCNTQQCLVQLLHTDDSVAIQLQIDCSHGEAIHDRSGHGLKWNPCHWQTRGQLRCAKFRSEKFGCGWNTTGGVGAAEKRVTYSAVQRHAKPSIVKGLPAPPHPWPPFSRTRASLAQSAAVGRGSKALSSQIPLELLFSRAGYRLGLASDFSPTIIDSCDDEEIHVIALYGLLAIRQCRSLMRRSAPDSAALAHV